MSYEDVLIREAVGEVDPEPIEPYCSHHGCLGTLNKATQVVQFNGHDEVMCQEHAGRLGAARKSDAKQDLGLKETVTPNPLT